MRLIKEEWNEGKWEYSIYLYEKSRWHRESGFKQMSRQDLVQIEKRLEIDMALVSIDDKWIEMLYLVIPSIQIIIKPSSLYSMIKSCRKRMEEWQDEVAITIERNNRAEQEEVGRFLQWFYRATTIDEAYRRYEIWQYYRSVQGILGNKMIEWFQLYEEEIFNYFKYSGLLACMKKGNMDVPFKLK